MTIAAAVIFSAVLALSLSPMMCSKLLRSSVKESRSRTRSTRRSWRCRTAISQCCARRCARRGCRLRPASAIAFGAYVLLQDIPQEYAPVEDRGQFNGQIQAPEGHELRAPARVGHEGRGRAAAVLRRRQHAARHRQRAGLGQQRLRDSERHAEAVRRAQDQHAGDAERSQQAVGRDPRRARQRLHEQRQPWRWRWRWWRRREPGAARARRPELRGARALARHHHRARVRESGPRAARFGFARDAAASARASRPRPRREPRRDGAQHRLDAPDLDERAPSNDVRRRRRRVRRRAAGQARAARQLLRFEQYLRACGSQRRAHPAVESHVSRGPGGAEPAAAPQPHARRDAVGPARAGLHARRGAGLLGEHHPHRAARARRRSTIAASRSSTRKPRARCTSRSASRCSSCSSCSRRSSKASCIRS